MDKAVDQVYEKNGKWYFYDETFTTSYGPFNTEEIARIKLGKYLELMG